MAFDSSATETRSGDLPEASLEWTGRTARQRNALAITATAGRGGGACGCGGTEEEKAMWPWGRRDASLTAQVAVQLDQTDLAFVES